MFGPLALLILQSCVIIVAARLVGVLARRVGQPAVIAEVLAGILSERKLIRSRLGSIALACAAADDVTAWCLLAFVVSFVHAKGLGAALVTTAEAASFAAFMLFVVRPLLARLGARITTRE